MRGALLAHADERPGEVLARIFEFAPVRLLILRSYLGNTLWYERDVDDELVEALVGARDAPSLSEALGLREGDARSTRPEEPRGPVLESFGPDAGPEPPSARVSAGAWSRDVLEVVVEVGALLGSSSELAVPQDLLEKGYELRAVVDSEHFSRPEGQTWEHVFRFPPGGASTAQEWRFPARATAERRLHRLGVHFSVGGLPVGAAVLTVSGVEHASSGGDLTLVRTDDDAPLLMVTREGSDLRARLSGRDVVATLAGVEDLIDRLGKSGADPREIGEDLATSMALFDDFFRGLDREGARLRISAEAPLAPFELIPLDRRKPDSPLLGERVAVARHVASAPPALTTPFGRTLACIRPSYAGTLELAETAGEEQDLLRRYPGAKHYATRGDLDVLLDRADVGIVHFAGHASGLKESQLRLEGDVQVAPTVFRASRPLLARARPLFFLNACEAGKAQLSWAAAKSLSNALIANGARGVVAPVISVESGAARRAAAAFYEALEGGDSVAEAVSAVRRLREGGSDGANTFASYLYFGGLGLRAESSKAPTKPIARSVEPAVARGDATAFAALPSVAVSFGGSPATASPPGLARGAVPVLVTGPREPTDAQRAAAARLGRWLVAEGFGLVIGTYPGVDELVLQEFRNALPTDLLRARVTYVLGPDQSASSLVGEVVRAGSQTTEFPIKAELGACAVVLGNAAGAAGVAGQVWQLRKPLYAMPGTGADELAVQGLSRLSWEQLQEELRSLRTLPPPEPELAWSGPPLVLVTGPQHASDAERAAAEELGRWLAQRGVGLLTGGYPGVDAAAAVAFSGLVPEPAGRLVQVIAIRRHAASNLGRLWRVESEAHEYPRSAALASCAVVIGNSPGTAGMASFARSVDKPTLAFPGTGADRLPANGLEAFADTSALYERLNALLTVDSRTPPDAPEARERPPEILSKTVLKASFEEGEDAPTPRPVDSPEPVASAGCVLSIQANDATLSMGTRTLWSGKLGDVRLDGKVVLGHEATRALPNLERQQAEGLGDALETALFGGPAPGEVASALTVPMGKQLRLVLELDRAAAAFPWEYLRIGGSFLLERRLSVVRLVGTKANVKPLPVRIQTARGLTVLFAWANPETTSYDHFDDRAHTTRLEDARPAGWSLKPLPRAAPEALRRALTTRSDAYDVFHFLGHGKVAAEGGLLALHPDTQGASVGVVQASELATWLGDGGAKLVALGACYSGSVPTSAQVSGVAEEIVKSTGIPVVAMQAAVPQEFSTAFLAEFYRRLAETQGDLEAAVYHARRVTVGGRSAFGIPVLYAAGFDAPTELPDDPPPTFSFAGQVLVTPADLKALLSPKLPSAAQAIVGRALDALPDEALFSPAPSAGQDDAAVRDAVAEIVRAVQERALQGVTEQDLQELDRAFRAPAGPRPLRVPIGSVEPLSDPELSRSWSDLAGRLSDVRTRLSLPDGLLETIVAELLAGRHVLLVGPVGTGKTSVAGEVAKAMGYLPFPATASSDWTPFEVVGGFWPQSVSEGGKSRLELRFRPGCVTEAVLQNWEEAPAVNGGPPGWRRRLDGGTWLVLDELNRADMDRAMGPLFTALETRRLRVPVAQEDEGGAATTELPIPADFRILATLNGVDRHYLFRLSDALKRRFAWIEVPVTLDWAREWELVGKRVRAGDDAAEALRHLVYLCRLVYPVGTAQLKAAVGFLAASADSPLTPAQRVGQAALGSVLPSLEEAPPAVHQLLLAWLGKKPDKEIAQAVERARAEGHGPPEGRVRAALEEALSAKPPATVEPFHWVAQALAPPPFEVPAVVRWLEERSRG